MDHIAYREHSNNTRNGDLTQQDERLNAALGIAGEAGELVDIVKKEIYHGHPQDPAKVLDEAGDELYYLDWLLETYGFTLEDAMRHNVEKLRARYPNGFSADASINRTVDA